MYNVLRARVIAKTKANAKQQKRVVISNSVGYGAVCPCTNFCPVTWALLVYCKNEAHGMRSSRSTFASASIRNMKCSNWMNKKNDFAKFILLKCCFPVGWIQIICLARLPMLVNWIEKKQREKKGRKLQRHPFEFFYFYCYKSCNARLLYYSACINVYVFI